jgi:hypothetical protein
MAVVSSPGDGIGEARGAEGRVPRQGKNYQKTYKTTRSCKAYMSSGQGVLVGDRRIPQGKGRKFFMAGQA